MKKNLFRILMALFAITLFTSQTIEACCGFIIGKGLTADGSVLYGRTEDYPYNPNYGRQNKNYVVVPATTYADTDMLFDESTGFTYPHLPSEMKYTATYDAIRGDGSNGNFGAHGFNEVGVSMTATVSTAPNKNILKVDPLVQEGLAEAILIDLVLPRVHSAREGIELIAKVIDEKGSAEGNIIVVADQNELWYMEVLSGHQYVAIKFPEDKYAVFANTYYLGHVNLADTANVIASTKVEQVAREANSFKEVNGQFHIAQSYGPATYDDGDRSRTYAGITLLDPQTSITYEDDFYDLLRQPTDPSKRFTLQDTLAFQRNRFEHLPQDLFIASDFPKRIDDPSAWNPYKYPLGNQNVIDAHVYQIKDSLPKEFGGILWLGLGRSRNALYAPFYGNVNDTYAAFKPRENDYNPDSWYWVSYNIDKMATEHEELFGNTIQEKLIALTEELIERQAALDAHYASVPAGDYSAEVTEKALAQSEEYFLKLKAIEAEMIAKINGQNTTTTTTTTTTTATTVTTTTSETTTTTVNEPQTTTVSTEESSTTQEQTTEETTTSEETTTVEPTTVEQTTSEETTTIEPTTVEPSTTVAPKINKPKQPKEPKTTQPAPKTTEEPKAHHTLKDGATGITVYNKDFAPGTTLNVAKVETVEALKSKTFDAYDIKLADAQKQPIHKVSPTQVTLPVKEGMQPEAVYYVKDDGQLEQLDSVVAQDNASVTFMTDHFSVYALTYKPAATGKQGGTNKGGLPKTGEQDSVLGIVGLIVLAFATIVFFDKKRRA